MGTERARERPSRLLKLEMEADWRRCPRDEVMPMSNPRRRESEDRRLRNGMSLMDENDVLREMSPLVMPSMSRLPSLDSMVRGRGRILAGMTAPRTSGAARTSRAVRESAKLSRRRRIGVSKRDEERRESKPLFVYWCCALLLAVERDSKKMSESARSTWMRWEPEARRRSRVAGWERRYSEVVVEGVGAPEGMLSEGESSTPWRSSRPVTV